MSTAKEPQNQVQFDLYHDATYGEANRLGPYTSHIWMTDPGTSVSCSPATNSSPRC
ncbi:MAG: hypothetical protein IPL58_02100 [Betaproteobacteria bacterium]|uniref:Uncharacterized protein n=1 Tax=Candidatus Proximibacter danicus TaxID=2954365 RepID=A0A9D7PQF8_9PROT|nr:hypothetical protein [Candidatus Proximibacter danicus]